MAPVFTQMRRYAVATGRDGELCCTHRIGVEAPTSIADSGHVIDINAQAEVIHALAVHAFGLCYHGLRA